MLKTNTIGSLIVSLVLLTIAGYLISLGFSLNWGMYFKAAGIIFVIAAIISLLSLGGDKPHSHT